MAANRKIRMHGVTPRDSLDRLAFFLAFLAGTVGSIMLKIEGVHPFGVAFFAAAVLIGYALLSWVSGKLMLEPEVLGDNCYYLGFLFTLASLGYTLYQVAAPGSSNTNADLLPEVISGFGVALSSTIVGVFLRVLLMQVRPDIMVRDRETRRELQDQVRDFRVALSESVQQIRTFSTESIQMSIEREAKIAESIDAAVKSAEERLAESSGIITDTLKETVSKQAQMIFNDLSRSVSESSEMAIHEISDGLTKIGKSATELKHAHVNALEQQRDNAVRVNQDIDRIQQSLASLARNMREIDESLQDVPITKTMAAFKENISRSTNDLAKMAVRLGEVSQNLENNISRSTVRKRGDGAWSAETAAELSQEDKPIGTPPEEPAARNSISLDQGNRVEPAAPARRPVLSVNPTVADAPQGRSMPPLRRGGSDE